MANPKAPRPGLPSSLETDVRPRAGHSCYFHFLFWWLHEAAAVAGARDREGTAVRRRAGRTGRVQTAGRRGPRRHQRSEGQLCIRGCPDTGKAGGQRTGGRPPARSVHPGEQQRCQPAAGQGRPARAGSALRARGRGGRGAGGEGEGRWDGARRRQPGREGHRG
ncbi:PREDICTED: protein argonaute 14-like, partial [Chinchilla lanigera]|uniref:protein argonaute 14-like n=1 Tax=Chinchilla lanigera TaxID=34839 RepID=UPI000697A29C